MKHLLTFETFVPKNVLDREAEAMAKGILVYNDREAYILTNGCKYAFGVSYATMQPSQHNFQGFLIELHSNKHESIDLRIAVTANLKSLTMAYGEITVDPHNPRYYHSVHFNPQLWFAANELEKLATRISRELIYILKIKQLLKPSTTSSQLYQLADQLQPQAVAALQAFKTW